MDPKRVVEEGFDRIAQRHAEWASRTRVPERACYLAAFCAAVPQGARVLELGCGAGGLVTSRLASRYRLTGVDISAKSIEMVAMVPGAEFLHRDMTQVRFPPATFDGVAAFYSIIHVPREEHGTLLARIGDWLRPGGVFVGTLGVFDVPSAYEEDWLGVQMFWSSYDAVTGRKLVESAGLRIESAVVETADEDGMPTSVLWIVARKPADQAGSGPGAGVV
jgi:SAM-dependent methyltransferase